MSNKMEIECGNCGCWVGKFPIHIDTVNGEVYRECPNCGYSITKLGDGEMDNVNHPEHYTNHPSGVECIDIAEHYPFNLGAVIKYVWRAGLKDDDIEDLEKAQWYLNREVDKRKKERRTH